MSTQPLTQKEIKKLQDRNCDIWDIFRERFTQEERDLVAEYTENELLIEAECNQ